MGNGGLLAGRGLCCWAGDKCTPRWGRAVLLGGNKVDSLLCYSAREWWDVRWESAVLFVGREVAY